MSGIAVAGFTFTLWRSTEKLWKAAVEERKDNDSARVVDAERVNVSLKLSAKAAIAAERQSLIAERALIASNRPHLIFQSAFSINDKFDLAAGDPPFLVYRFHNYGASPAIIQESFATVMITDEVVAADYVLSELTIRHYYILPVDGETDRKRIFHDGGSVAAADRYRIAQGAKFIFAVGRIVYSGVLGSQHETRFCWRYMPETSEFQEYGGPEYNVRT